MATDQQKRIEILQIPSKTVTGRTNLSRQAAASYFISELQLVLVRFEHGSAAVSFRVVTGLAYDGYAD
ncbi:MAG: hypothetical protein Tsb009_11180 [Planctomycetaceae bacterium]